MRYFDWMFKYLTDKALLPYLNEFNLEPTDQNLTSSKIVRESKRIIDIMVTKEIPTWDTLELDESN